MTKYLPASLTLFLLLSSRLSAQQDPLFSNYMFNKMIYNPAAAGSDTGYVTARGLYQDQWSNFHDPEGASSPISEAGSIDGSIRLKTRQFYIGTGLSYTHYSAGFMEQNEYMVSAACHYLPSFGGDLSVGINGGTVNEYIKPSWRVLEDPISPAFRSKNGFDAGIGLYYSTRNYYIGISALNVLNTNLTWGYDANYPVRPMYAISGGYNFFLNHNKDFELQPSFFMETHDATYYSMAVSGIFLYKQRVWAGLDFKGDNSTSMSVLAGVVIVKGKYGDLSAGGSYAYVSSTPTEFGGALELMLSGRIKI